MVQFSRNFAVGRDPRKIKSTKYIPSLSKVKAIIHKRTKIRFCSSHFLDINQTTTQVLCYVVGKALLTPTPRPVRDLLATDFFATDRRSMRLVQPLYALIRIEDYNRQLGGDRFATGLRLTGDWLPWTRRHVCNQVKPIGD